MAEQTGISWTDATWNPWYGCHLVSGECDFCYMFSEMRRYGKEPNIVQRSKTKFYDPLKWARAGNSPAMCFTCSWSDWFIREADPWRMEAWGITRQTPQTIYQILTKRAGRAASHLPPDWGTGYPNVWLGTSVGLRATRQRISTLRSVPAACRFVSFEPLLEDIGDVDLTGYRWAIVGGESGAKHRPMKLAWARRLRDQCREQGVAFFMKQLGGFPDKRDVLLNFPADLQIQEYPEVQS